MTETEKDLLLHGISFTLNGQRLPPEQVHVSVRRKEPTIQWLPSFAEYKSGALLRLDDCQVFIEYGPKFGFVIRHILTECRTLPEQRVVDLWLERKVYVKPAPTVRGIAIGELKIDL